MDLFGHWKDAEPLDDEGTIRHALKCLAHGGTEGTEIAEEASQALTRLLTQRRAVAPSAVVARLREMAAVLDAEDVPRTARTLTVAAQVVEEEFVHHPRGAVSDA